MEYQNYENYMRGILGYRNDNNIYNNSFTTSDDGYYEGYYNPAGQMNNVNMEDLNNMYPEIYKITYPIVCRLCNQNQNRQITRELINTMVDEIYNIIEPESKDENSNQTRNQIPLKNGDVRNPHVKETEEKKETRHKDYVLQDLIRILILREFGNIRRTSKNPNPPHFRPQTPYYGQPYGMDYR